MTRSDPGAAQLVSTRPNPLRRRVLLASIGVVAAGCVVLALAERASAANVTLNSANYPTGFTVPAGDTWTLNPNANTTITSGGNIIVRGTLVMAPANGNITHTIRFTGINEANFVGGGMDPIASDVGLWVVGAGRIVLQGETKPAWSYAYQSSWAGDEVLAAPNTPGNYNGFTAVTGTPAKNALGYATELLNLTRNVRIEGTPTGYSHVFIRSSSVSTIRNAAFRYVGPDPAVIPGSDDSTGRYGLHIHMNGNWTRGMVVDGLVIRDTKAHAFVPHGSHGITFRNTIAFNVRGEAYWWDDPAGGMMNESDDIVFDRTVAARVTQASGGNNHRLGAYYLGAGENPVVINSVAVGVQAQSGANRSGFIWPEDSQGTWVFKNNRAHNNGGNGIFVWQNNELPHLIDGFIAYYNGQAGVEHGAYTNSYVYKNLVLLGNGRAIHSHALGEPGDDGNTDTQVWSNVRTNGGTLYIDEHARPLERPVRFVDCDLGRVDVNEQGGVAGAYDFIRCGLEPSDFDLAGAHPNSVFRVQRPNGTAYRLTGAGALTTIPKFYHDVAPGVPVALAGDYDATGTTDLAVFGPAAGTWWVLESEAGAFNPTLWADFSTASGWEGRMTGDFNGDGRGDIAQFHPSNGTWWVSRSTGTAFTTNIWADFSTASGWQSRLVGDFNGDGRDDIAQFHGGTGAWWVSRSTGSGFATTRWADFTTASGWQAQVVGDFNGDGRDDIAQYHPSNGTWWVSRSTGSGFVTTMWADFSTATGWDARMAGDFNGDGRDDIAQFHSASGAWWVSRSTGSGFATTRWADFTTASGWQGRLVGDFNGDGRDDIAQYHPSNGTWWVSRSSGSAFSTGLWADFSTASGWQSRLVGDFNGDGRDDIAQYHQSSTAWWVSRSTGSGFTTTRWTIFAP